MYCSKCGVEIKGDGKFCPQCGNEIVKKVNTSVQRPIQRRKGSIAILSLVVLVIAIICIMALFGRNKRPEGTYVALDYDSTWGGGLYLTFESDSIVQVEEDYDEFEFNYTIENGDQIFIDNGRMVLTYDYNGLIN